jgi:hypothetical protein
MISHNSLSLWSQDILDGRKTPAALTHFSYGNVQEYLGLQAFPMGCEMSKHTTTDARVINSDDNYLGCGIVVSPRGVSHRIKNRRLNNKTTHLVLLPPER